MQTLKRTAKQTLLQTLKRTGVFRGIAQSRWRRERLLILCYHGIALEDEHEWRPSTFMTASLFESRLRMLRDGGYTVLPLEEALTKLYAGELPPKSAVITFDDGLYNFHARAMPLLNQYRFPATLYLTTFYCDPQRPVFPLICAYLFWKSRQRVMPANPSLGFPEAVDLTTVAGRQQAETGIAAYASEKNMTADERNDLAKRLAVHLGLDFDRLSSQRLFHLMTPAEVRDAADKGIDIQLHTHRHRTPADRALFLREIVENRVKIVDFAGTKPRHFCYPSGVYRLDNLPWLAEQEVASATTCVHGLANAQSQALLLPRFLDSSNVAPIEFESWLTGLGAFLRERLRR